MSELRSLHLVGGPQHSRPRPGVVQHRRISNPTATTHTDRSRGVSLVLCTYRRAASVRRFLDSVVRQTRPVDELIVVDASPDAETEAVVGDFARIPGLTYWRVEDPLRGLTRQRNFGLDMVTRDLVGFFDDDVVLDDRCLEHMERAHRTSKGLVGVGCFAEVPTKPTPLWRLRRLLGVVPHLRPGSYTRTGISVPWRFQGPTEGLVDGDWLPGCAMMIKTDVALKVRFDEGLVGYGQGEDLDFSLRLRQRGRIAMAGLAHCQHLHAPAGRPDAFKLGHMEICNRYVIWRRVHRNPRLTDRLAFAYAWSLDTLMLARDAVRPRDAANGIRRIAGRLLGASRVLTNRVPV